MNKLFLLLVVTLMSISSFASVTVTQTKERISYLFKVEGVNTKLIQRDGQKFAQVTFKGIGDHQGVFGQIGNPELPVIQFVLETSDINSIKITWEAESNKALALSAPLYPVQPSFSKSASKRPDLVINKSVQDIKDRYKIRPIGSVNGVKRVLVTLFPYEYQSLTHSYKLYSTFKVAAKAAQHKSVDQESILFIVGSAFKDSAGLKKYMEFKQELGFKVITHVVNFFNRKPEKIRAKIKEVYNQEAGRLKYILIIGDSGDVPGQEAKFIVGTTDNYYRSIDTDDYESDINSPDLGVGRLTIKNSAQLDSVLNKLMIYQKGEFSDESWLDRIAFIATNDRYTIAEGSHNYAIDNYTAPANYIGHFPEQNQLGGDKLYAITHHASGRDVVKAMKDGRFIVNYSGHGSVKTWAGPRVTQSDIRSLEHSDARPFVISNACITGQFTRKESFAETWIRHPQGAIMMWASMDSTYWDEDDLLERAMYDAIFKLKLQNFNKITQYALDKVFVHYGPDRKGNYYWETYHTFGDPSIRLRDGRTVDITIEGELSAHVGSKGHQIKVLSSDGSPLVGARVALVDPNKDGLRTTAYTDENGVANLNMTHFTQSGELKLSIYGHNTKVVFKSFKLLK